MGGGWRWSMQMTDVLEPRIRGSQPRSRSRVNISTISTTSRLLGGEARHLPSSALVTAILVLAIDQYSVL